MTGTDHMLDPLKGTGAHRKFIQAYTEQKRGKFLVARHCSAHANPFPCFMCHINYVRNQL